MESSTWNRQRSGLLIKLRTHLCELLQELQNLKNYEANAPVVIIGFGPMGQVIYVLSLPWNLALRVLVLPQS
jgi:hypothetical protein